MSHLDGQGDGGDAPPVEAVGGRAGQREQDQRRQELDEPEQAERELAVGDVVEVLAEGRGLQRRPDRRERGAEQVRAHGSITEQLPAARHDERLVGLHDRATLQRRARTAEMASLTEHTRWMDAVDQAALVAKGEVTPARAAGGGDRADGGGRPAGARVDDHVVRPRQGLAAGELPDGPFRGVPFLLKDLYTNFAGQTLSNGNSALKDGRRSSTNRGTARSSPYRAAGSVISGGNSPGTGR